MAEVDEKVKSLDDELTAMEKRREEIEAEKINLAKARIAALARTAPVNKLIPEIASKIFEFAAIVDDKEGVELPMRLVTVSHSWRRMALASPRVWGRVAVEIEDENQARPMIRRAAAYLERSVATQIDVLVDIGQWGSSDDRPRLVNEILELLAPHMERTIRLVVRAREEQDSPTVFKILTPHFGPILTDFSIESRDSVRLDVPVMPFLNRLYLDDVGPRNGWSSALLCNLKSLSVRYFKPITFEPFLTALESAKDNLEELRISRCTLAFETNAFLFPSADHRPTFPVLKTLAFVDVLPGDVRAQLLIWAFADGRA